MKNKNYSKTYRYKTYRLSRQWLVSYLQGSHASWKVLDIFLKIPGPGKSWKIALVLESPEN